MNAHLPRRWFAARFELAEIGSRCSLQLPGIANDDLSPALVSGNQAANSHFAACQGLKVAEFFPVRGENHGRERTIPVVSAEIKKRIAGLRGICAEHVAGNAAGFPGVLLCLPEVDAGAGSAARRSFPARSPAVVIFPNADQKADRQSERRRDDAVSSSHRWPANPDCQPFSTQYTKARPQSRRRPPAGRG